MEGMFDNIAWAVGFCIAVVFIVAFALGALLF